MEDEGLRADMAKAARIRFDLTFDSGVVGPVMEQFLMSGTSGPRDEVTGELTS